MVVPGPGSQRFCRQPPSTRVRWIGNNDAMATVYKDTDWFRGARSDSPELTGARLGDRAGEHGHWPVRDLAPPEGR